MDFGIGEDIERAHCEGVARGVRARIHEKHGFVAERDVREVIVRVFEEFMVDCELVVIGENLPVGPHFLDLVCEQLFGIIG